MYFMLDVVQLLHRSYAAFDSENTPKDLILAPLNLKQRK